MSPLPSCLNVNNFRPQRIALWLHARVNIHCTKKERGRERHGPGEENCSGWSGRVTSYLHCLAGLAVGLNLFTSVDWHSVGERSVSGRILEIRVSASKRAIFVMSLISWPIFILFVLSDRARWRLQNLYTKFSKLINYANLCKCIQNHQKNHTKMLLLLHFSTDFDLVCFIW